jgi:hypothetical protein
LSVSDVDLLRRFEPIVRYTHGEFFFPMRVDPYIAECDLWGVDPDGRRTRLVPAGELTVDTLPGWTSRVPDQTLFLRFVQEPLTATAVAQRRQHTDRPRFHAPSRLARVGVVARLIDAGFDLSLLVRGTVPGGTVAAGELKYAAIRSQDPGLYYHGRVVRQAGWTVCHYLFFYAMNDWRSSFQGANDHEADWEQCFVFLEERPDGSPEPIWFARAAHDEVGADLRRRWDDPLLRREGDHPIIFAGAGSHAAYIEPGEYLQAVPLRLPRRMRGAATALRTFWTTTLGQGRDDPDASASSVAAVPFVDYARGDGLAIGPGQPNAWMPVLIDDAVPWVSGFDGLFGLDTEDRLAGERAPAGPKWARDGRPRQSWVDPIAFAGLDATPPPTRAVAVISAEIDELGDRLAAGRGSVGELEERTQRLGVRVAAAERAGRSGAYVEAIAAERDSAIEQLRALRIELDGLAAARDDSEAELARVRAGEAGDPRAHLHLVVHPQDPSEIRRSRLLDVWSAFSVAVAILLLGSLLITHVAPWWVGLIVIAAGYVAIEALVRRRFLRLLLDLTVALAVAGAAILLVTNAGLFIAIGLLGIGVVILRDNLREMRQAA